MFHWKDGLFFGRRANGDVRVIKFRDAAHFPPFVEEPRCPEAVLDINIPSEEWDSIVTSVTRV